MPSMVRGRLGMTELPARRLLRLAWTQVLTVSISDCEDPSDRTRTQDCTSTERSLHTRYHCNLLVHSTILVAHRLGSQCAVGGSPLQVLEKTTQEHSLSLQVPEAPVQHLPCDFGRLNWNPCHAYTYRPSLSAGSSPLGVCTSCLSLRKEWTISTFFY